MKEVHIAMTSQIQSTTSHNFLQNVLRGNGLFCVSSGIIVTLLAGLLAEAADLVDPAFGLSGEAFLRGLGLVLIPYGAFLLWAFSRWTQPIAWLATVGDVAWVLASVAILLTDAFAMNSFGNWFTFLIGDAVLAFALLQLWGLRRQ